MAYKTGFVNNSHQLAQIIHAAMREAGWTLVSGQFPDGTSSVFYSAGEDGNQDIYLRAAARQADSIVDGDVQFPSADGYTGFVNFFAYQYFPQDGYVNDGFNEIGRFGPMIYTFDDGSSSFEDLRETNFYSSTDGTEHSRELRSRPNSSGTYVNHCHDGHRFMWHNNSSNNSMAYFDLAREVGVVFASTRTSTNFLSQAEDYGAVIWSRKSSIEPLIWSLKEGTWAGWATYNWITDEEIDAGAVASVYAQPPWGTSNNGIQPWVVQGSRRNGKKYLYVQRADSSSWAIYDLDENKWTSLGFNPNTAGDGSQAVFVPKESSGYSEDRIYRVRGGNTTQFYSIRINDDGLPDDSWYQHTSFPGGNLNSQASFFYLGGNRIFLAREDNDDLQYFTLPTGDPKQGGAWVDIDPWWSHTNYGNTAIGVQNHLCSRAKVDEFEQTKYWIFVDKDRIVVVTETAESKLVADHNFCYAGLFESTYDTSSFTTLTNAAASTDTILKVSDVSSFKVGSKYRLINNVSSSPSTTYTSFAGTSHEVLSAEIVTITGISQSASPQELTISPPLDGDYPAGAKIGQEIQPVCLWVDSMDRVQVLNSVSGAGTPAVNHISNNPPYQWYTIQQPQLSLQTLSERTDGIAVWPFLLSHTGTSDSVAGITQADSRGQLKNVYKTGTIGNEGTVQIGGKTYIAFTGFNSPLLGRIVVGPAE